MLPLCRHSSLPHVEARRAGRAAPRRTSALALLVVCAALAVSGCKTSKKVSVPQLLTPMVEADTSQLVAEINRVAAVRSIRGKVDIQFLDTSFAKCGVAEKYRMADGTITLQRPGQILLVIQIPFVGSDVAQMTSDGEHFRVAVLKGDDKYRNFVRGTNNAVYGKMGANEAEPDCSGDANKEKAVNARTVNALSSLRPQHITDAFMLPPIAQGDSKYIYAQTEDFAEEADTRPGAKKGARVVRPFYVLVELAPQGTDRARVVRRFWFDRIGELRLARVQTFDDGGKLTTDVVYKEPKKFGEDGRYKLPSVVEVTRPQDRYSLRINYQAPETVTIDREWRKDLFDLKNTWNLPEVNLDERNAKK